jgi:hypothetical protein
MLYILRDGAPSPPDKVCGVGADNQEIHIVNNGPDAPDIQQVRPE